MPCSRQRFSTLTALETRVISTILSQCTVDATTLLKVIADEAHVSKAMVVKIAKELGFGGFRALRAARGLYAAPQRDFYGAGGAAGPQKWRASHRPDQ